MAIAPHSASVVVFDLPATLQFLGSVALAEAIQFNTNMQWKDYKDSTVLNVIYAAFLGFKGRPGWVEVEQNWNVIRQRQQELWLRHVETFLKKLREGPHSVCLFLERMQEVKNSALQGVQAVFRDAQQINAEIAGETTRAIENLALIKCGATITLAALTGGLAITGATVAVVVEAGAVSLGYKVAAHFAKDLQQAKSAQAIAVDLGKNTGKEVAEDKLIQPGAEWTFRWLLTRPGTIAFAQKLGLFGNATGAIEEYSRQLANARTVARQAKLTARIAGKQSGMATALGTVATRVVPVVFAIKDIVEAVDEYREDTR
jgi:hypothetical protein